MKVEYQKKKNSPCAMTVANVHVNDNPFVGTVLEVAQAEFQNRKPGILESENVLITVINGTDASRYVAIPFTQAAFSAEIADDMAMTLHDSSHLGKTYGSSYEDFVDDFACSLSIARHGGIQIIQKEDGCEFLFLCMNVYSKINLVS